MNLMLNKKLSSVTDLDLKYKKCDLPEYTL